jgi:hypothetical protein
MSTQGRPTHASPDLHPHLRRPSSLRLASSPRRTRPRRGFTLNSPTNKEELQSALNQVITRLADNRLDTRRAGLLLYSLQLAGQHLTAF